MIRGVGPLKRPCCVGLADHCCQFPGKLFGHFVKKNSAIDFWVQILVKNAFLLINLSYVV